jgi:hypothetical protein
MNRSVLVAVIGAIALTAVTFAAVKPKEEWATGQIERVDMTAKSLVVKQGTHEMTFGLAPDAQLILGKKTLQTSELSNDVGKRVKVRYTTQGTSKIANRLELVETTAAAKPMSGHTKG